MNFSSSNFNFREYICTLNNLIKKNELSYFKKFLQKLSLQDMLKPNSWHGFIGNGSRQNIAYLWKLFSYITIRILKISFRNCVSSLLSTHYKIMKDIEMCRICIKILLIIWKIKICGLACQNFLLFYLLVMLTFTKTWRFQLKGLIG